MCLLVVLANALTFRFAELVQYLGGNERNTGDIVAWGLAASVLVRLPEVDEAFLEKLITDSYDLAASRPPPRPRRRKSVA